MVPETDPDGNDLQDAPPHRRQQVEFVLLGAGHDIQNADTQRANILMLGRLFAQPRHVVLVEQGLQAMIGC